MNGLKVKFVNLHEKLRNNQKFLFLIHFWKWTFMNDPERSKLEWTFVNVQNGDERSWTFTNVHLGNMWKTSIVSAGVGKVFPKITWLGLKPVEACIALL